MSSKGEFGKALMIIGIVLLLVLFSNVNNSVRLDFVDGALAVVGIVLLIVAGMLGGIRLTNLGLRIVGLISGSYAFYAFYSSVIGRSDIATASLTPVFGWQVLFTLAFLAVGSFIDSAMGVIAERKHVKEERKNL